MVAATLDQERIDAGRALIALMRAEYQDPHAVFWLYDAESLGWRLMIADPQVTKGGPLEAYQNIQQLLAKLPEEHQESLRLPDISLMPPKNPLVELMKESAMLRPGTRPIRLSGAVVDGRLIESAYVYRGV